MLPRRGRGSPEAHVVGGGRTGLRASTTSDTGRKVGRALACGRDRRACRGDSCRRGQKLRPKSGLGSRSSSTWCHARGRQGRLCLRDACSRARPDPTSQVDAVGRIDPTSATGTKRARKSPPPGRGSQSPRRDAQILRYGGGLLSEPWRRKPVDGALAVEPQRDVDDTQIGNVGMRQVHQHAQCVKLRVRDEVGNGTDAATRDVWAPRRTSHSSAPFARKRSSNTSRRTLRLATLSALLA